MTKETIKEAIVRIKLEIARLDYSGKKYISDKQFIADSFSHSIFQDEVGCITDQCEGKCWIVYLTSTGKFNYHRAI
jgi:hypothetical protein